MGLKISKKDLKMMIEQSKQMIKISEIDKKIATEAIRKTNMDIAAAKAIVKFLGGK